MDHGWQLIASEWAALRERVSGLRWRKVRFRELDQDTVPRAPGVYALCSPPPFGVRDHLPRNLYEVLYVGKSKDLRGRFLQHLSSTKPEMLQIGECYGHADVSFWFVALDASRISETESVLISCFGPPANVKRGTSITATLGPGVPA
jgi:excinuclease UvrABC nuclease subunit